MQYYLQVNFQDNALHRLGADPARLRSVLGELGRFRVLDGLRYYKSAAPRKRSLVEFSSWSEIKGVPEDYIRVGDRSRLEDAAKALEVNVLFDRVSLEMESQSPCAEVAEQAEESLSSLLAVAQEHGLSLDVWSGLRVLGTQFRRPRPPRDMGKIWADAVLDLINTRAPKPPAELGHLLEAYQKELPAYASARAVGPYLLINWAAKGGGGERPAEAVLTDRLVWYYGHASFPPLDSYNESGDSQVVLLNPVRHSFYTFYVPFDNTAYKAVVPASDRLSEDDSVASAANDLKRGATSDGAPLSAVTLILPSRELAVQHHDEALRLGFKSTSYPDSEGNLWELSPRGDWME